MDSVPELSGHAMVEESHHPRPQPLGSKTHVARRITLVNVPCGPPVSHPDSRPEVNHQPGASPRNPSLVLSLLLPGLESCYL